jgi:hypothetical protein
MGKLPTLVKIVLQSVQLEENPYDLDVEKREDWMEGLDIQHCHGRRPRFTA